MTQEQAIALAKRVAKKHKGAHDYLEHADDPAWLPHEWVVAAIMQAAGDPVAELHRALSRSLNTDESGGTPWIAQLCDATDPNPIPKRRA